MDIAFGILFAAGGTLKRKSFPRSVLSILFTHNTTVTPQQSKTRDRKTFQLCSSFFFFTDSTGLRHYTSRGTACEADPSQAG